jgi:uncharacterized glyoxalase superfamily protein PhnB
MTSNGLVPLIRYRDVAAAVDWLCNAFAFEKRNVVTDPDGTVAYAELSYGRGIVMLGPVGQSVLDSLMKQPDEIGGIGTQSVYVAVDDVEAHFKHARAAGAKIVLEFGSDEAGDRAYAARDLEGHIWNFGAYSPWPAGMATSLAPAAEPAYISRPSLSQAVLGGAVATLALASAAAVALFDPPTAAPKLVARSVAPAAAPAVAPVSPAPELAQEAAALRETLEREAHARQEAARVAAAVREELSREKAARLAAETARADLEQELSRSRQAIVEADKSTSPPATAAAPSAPVPAPVLVLPASPPPAPAAATAVAPTPEPPSMTGSLGDAPSDAVNQPTAAEPPPSVTVVPPPPAAEAAPPASPPAVKKVVKPKTTRQTRAPQKKPPPRKGGNDPLFMYD